MCVYVCVCSCVCVYLRVCACVFVYVCVCWHSQRLQISFFVQVEEKDQTTGPWNFAISFAIRRCVCVCTCVCVCVCLCVCACVCLCECVCVYVYCCIEQRKNQRIASKENMNYLVAFAVQVRQGKDGKKCFRCLFQIGKSKTKEILFHLMLQSVSWI